MCITLYSLNNKSGKIINYSRKTFFKERLHHRYNGYSTFDCQPVLQQHTGEKKCMPKLFATNSIPQTTACDL